MDAGVSEDAMQLAEVTMLSEARTGFEPVCDGFANRCLTTWLPRQELRLDPAILSTGSGESAHGGERSCRRPGDGSSAQAASPVT